jgi:multidrug resistance efflux pump
LAIALVLGFVIRVPRVVLATGYVTTEEYAEVRTTVAGIVREIRAQSGDQVEHGALLAQLDDSEQRADVEEARSMLGKAEAELARGRAQIVQQKRELEDRIEIAVLREKNAQTKLGRAEELCSRGLAAAAAVEDIRLQHAMARAELEALRKRDLSLFDKELAVRQHEVDGRREHVARGLVLVRQREIRSPLAGEVVRHDFVAGELVQPDMTLYEIFGGKKRVLKLRIDERHATQVAPGHPYRARLTSYGGLQNLWFEGAVESLRGIIQLEGQKTYRTAYCRFDAMGYNVPPGATAEARITTGRIPLWIYLLGLY